MRNGTTTRVGKKVTTALLTLTMALGTVSVAPTVALAAVGDKSLGTSGIAATTDKFSGSYVYYGKYDGTNPTKYRVLDNETTDFTNGGDKTMLLDSDKILETTQYHESSNQWSGSTLKSRVQGESFLTKQGNFTPQESAAIAASSKDESGRDFALSGEQVFVLSVSEASSYYTNDNARKKTGGDGHWWLRSAGYLGGYAAFVDDDGNVFSGGAPVYNDHFGVSPAFNVNLNSVIFSSEISGSDYKLTLKDADKLSASGSATLDGTIATITYTTTGDAATQASYVVTDATWGDSGWQWVEGATGPTVLSYGRLGDPGSGTGTVDVPTTGTWGTDYHVYVLAEQVVGGNATDYASVPVEITTEVSMLRVYNPWSGEHLYTDSAKERDALVEAGWRNEGIAWKAPKSSKTPVWRLYNQYSGDHHFTTDRAEYDELGKIGWTQEGVGFYSDDAKGVAVWRLFNPNAVIGTHHYTTGLTEYNTLPTHGWVQEGVGWYGLK